MSKNKVKAIGYVRVATTVQTKRSISLEMQKRQIVEAANHSGLEIVEWFEQIGYEPVTFIHDTLGQALGFCREDPGIKYLIVANTTRISRSLDHFIFWKIAFEREGVKIKIADGSDIDSSLGIFTHAIEEMLDKYEKKPR